MNENQFVPICLDDRFQFRCHHGVPCFNQCCRDLNQALTPFDVVMLRKHLGLSWAAFKDTYAAVHTGPATGLPVVALRFDQVEDRRCPFVTATGCRVYDARPASCRLYPLARALHRSPQTGDVTEHFALLHEAHCKGFEQDHTFSVREYIADQQLAPYFEGNDALFEVISLKNRLGKRPLPPSRQQWVMMALYDLDRLRETVAGGCFPGAGDPRLLPVPDTDDDLTWLDWSMVWIKLVLSEPDMIARQP